MTTQHVVRRRTLLTALASAPLLVGLSACAGGSQGAGTADATGRIKLAMLQPPRSALTPFSDDAFKLSRWSAAEPLILLDENGDPEPLLATSWEQTDGNTWRFTLRDGVTFHDGALLDAAAVVTALRAAIAASPKPRILDGVEMEVEELDPQTVQVRTADVDPLVPGRLSSPQLVILSPEAYAGSTVSPIGRGTGAFELTELNGTTSATLQRYEDYWGERAAADGIDVSFVPDGTARGAALRTGEAQLVEAVPVSQVALLDQELIHEVPMPRTNTLYLNVTSETFSDPALRAVVREAVDREGLVESVYEGHADVAAGLLGPAVPWAAELRETPSYRAAGTPSGQSITIGTFTDRSELPEVAVALENALKERGFEVRQDIREYANIEEDALAGAFDIFILSRATILDSGDPVAYMVSDFSSEGSFNLSQIQDPAVDEALRRASEAPVGEERRRAIMAAERVILETDAAIPLLHERVIQGEATGLSGAVRDPRERALVDSATRLES
ncbi:ABC transporter substrate-binding protein [Rothia sp. AR01]|uniref:ABC transporter substrate-binding protein n=1 Tax=Rothia santali TaxID=2949643 RepID=A0A9X2KIX4_9MICC|nr:ABC transporter substrate-binding protein [Rothia santali]MCP3426668.1 ABC transporter substrate-binding protein [Rothia santali]